MFWINYCFIGEINCVVITLKRLKSSFREEICKLYHIIISYELINSQYIIIVKKLHFFYSTIT